MRFVLPSMSFILGAAAGAYIGYKTQTDVATGSIFTSVGIMLLGHFFNSRSVETFGVGMLMAVIVFNLLKSYTTLI